jgi:hypothetical protein
MAFEMLEDPSQIVTKEMAAEAAHRHDAIAQRAFQLAAKRGFAPGHALDDWLAAEQQREAWERGYGRDAGWP